VARYRIALAAVAIVIATAVVITVVRQAGPTISNGASASSALLPEGSRPAAPEFTGIDGWINSTPLTIAGLHGQVVLIDFWTFSCVNCVRTIPHLQQLDDTYRGKGLVIVGVHSPEFDFERMAGNVRAAVSRLGVSWPVAIDSEMATWNAWSNSYWPAEYLIDRQGRVAYVHFGEGDYQVTDGAVGALLGLKSGPTPAASPPSSTMTPELYAGSSRGKLADGESYGPLGQAVDYGDKPAPQASDAIQVTGRWADYGEYLQAAGPARVRLNFQAHDVFVVTGSAAGTLTVTVNVDGTAVPTQLSGSALTASQFTVTRQDLYQLVTNEGSGYHLIELSVPAGFRLYTLTFG
jgi:thiol-disulfide isomerase/thioredoxin